MRCGSCDEPISFGLIQCPECGASQDRLAALKPKQPKKPKESKKARARREAALAAAKAAKDAEPAVKPAAPAPPSHVMAKLTSGGSGYALIRLDGCATPIQPRLELDLPASLLEGIRLMWVLDRSCDPPAASPAECEEVRAIRVYAKGLRALGGDPTVHGLIGLQRPGSTPLERLDSLLGQLDRIKELESADGLPVAWSELASAMRLERLHDPLVDAMTSIGWAHFKWLVTAYPNNDWPEPLLDWLHDAEEEAKRRTENYQSVLSFDHSQYGMADW